MNFILVLSYVPLHVPTPLRPLPVPARSAACVAQATPGAAPLDLPAAAALCEASFVPAVLGLARGDVTELKLFVAAASYARSEAFPVDDICAAMDAVPMQTAGRTLAAEEQDLRRMWLAFIYLTAERLTGKPAVAVADACPSDLRASSEELVAATLEAKQRGTPLSALAVELAPNLERHAAGVGGAALNLSAATALSLRVVYVTDDVLEAVSLAGQRTDARGPPERQPPSSFIPGGGSSV